MRSPPTEASTTAMALAMAAALKKRKADMELNTAHRAWFSVGQVSMIVGVERDNPLVGRGAYHITDFLEGDDGTLLVNLDKVEQGVCFTNSQSRPNDFTLSQSFSQRHAFFDRLKDLPQFGKTEVSMVVGDRDYNHIRLHVPAERRRLMRRALKSERAQALAQAIQTTQSLHSEAEFRAALKLVNKYRDQQSGNVKFRVNEEGYVKATLLVEY